MSTLSPPDQAQDVDAERSVVLSPVSWQLYQLLDADLDNVPGVRMVFLDERLEIVSPISRRHERMKSHLARLLEHYFEEADIAFFFWGSTSLRAELKNAGCEPDEGYCLGTDKEERPDLLLEISVSGRILNKLELYRRFEIPEVWEWCHGELTAFILDQGAYQPHKQSQLVPGIDLATLATAAEEPHLAAALKRFRMGPAPENPKN